MAKKKIRADLILRQIEKRHTRGQTPDAFFTEVKNGPTWFSNNLLRLDAVAFKKSWKNPCITGYEVKVDRQDFLRDDKWPGYRQYCHRFYFACPAGLIAPEELPDDVGLIWYNPEKDCIYTKRKAAFRDIKIPWEMLYYLVISRLDSDRHPFFSSRREYLEAWVQDKEDCRFLGYEVRNKMTQLIDSLTKQVNDLKKELERQKDDIAKAKRIEEILERHGIRTYWWRMEKDLEEALSNAMPPRLVRSLHTINEEINRIMASLDQKT